jgi:hypothetical protein
MGGYGLGGYGEGGYGTGSGVSNLAFEQGFVALVNSDAGVSAVGSSGGYFAQLPKDKIPGWTYLVVSDPSDYTLQGAVELSGMRLQVDCYGSTAAQAITLAKAIDRLLSGYQGTLPDGTVVQGCFRTNRLSFFDDNARNYRRMLEYEIWYVEP